MTVCKCGLLICKGLLWNSNAIYCAQTGLVIIESLGNLLAVVRPELGEVVLHQLRAVVSGGSLEQNMREIS